MSYRSSKKPFWETFSPLSQVNSPFHWDMRYGIIAAADIKRSRILRAFKSTPSRVENIRLRKYEKLKAMAAILLVTVYFSMAWRDNTEKDALVAATIVYKVLRLHAVPEYHFYTIADGRREVLAHGHKWNASTLKKSLDEKAFSPFMYFGLDSTQSAKPLPPVTTSLRERSARSYSFFTFHPYEKAYFNRN